MSGIVGKMAELARGRAPTEPDDDDCEICRMLATQSTVVETITLPDGSVLELRSVDDAAPTSRGSRRT